MRVAIAKVSTRDGARQHLDVDGRAHCGAGTGTTLAATRWDIDGTVVRTTICLRCTKALQARLAEAAAAGSTAASHALHTLTPADVAARHDATLAADMAAFLAARWAPPAPLTYDEQLALRAELFAA